MSIFRQINALVFLLLTSATAFAGGGAFIEVLSEDVIVSCNNGKVKYFKKVLEYDGWDVEYRYFVQAFVDGKQKLQFGSQLNFIDDDDSKGVEAGTYAFQIWNEEERELINGIAEMEIKFDGSKGVLSAWSAKGDYNQKKDKLLFTLQLEHCYPE